MITEYCAASCDDSEDYERQIDGTWWGAAIEWDGEHGDERGEDEEDFNRLSVTVAVGIARNPLPPSEMLRSPRSVCDLMIQLTESHDDYQGEWADTYPALFDAKNIKQQDAIHELGAGIAAALAKYERDYAGKPTWFCVDHPAEITLGLAEACAMLAAQIDLSGTLLRDCMHMSRWIQKSSDVAAREGHAEILATYDIWQAAALCGLTAPAKPKRVPGEP